MPADQSITIRGAREHNLRDITVELPRNRLICITGLSGSGKSSLAFDTLYAEGQRRYVESLSADARQFLGQMEKPDVDGIEGLSPAISIDQKTTSRNPRSTVGTVTEIYDYLRLLFARVGHPHCPTCGRAITGQSAEQIVDQVLRLPAESKFTVDAPIVRGRKGEFKDVIERLRGEGFTRIKVDGETLLLEDEIVLDKKFKHDLSVVVDRLVLKDDLRRRLTDSVETALQLADGLVDIAIVDGETMTFSERFACPDHGVSLAELAPRVFSFNSPHGACPHCHGLGALPELDPDLVQPDPEQTLSGGALQPWNVAGTNFFESLVVAIAERFEVDLDTPWGELSDAQRALFLEGTDGERVMVSYRNRYGRKRAYAVAWEGLLRSLKRRYDETESQLQKDKIEEWMTLRPCPECHGARLKPESLAVTVGGLSIHRATDQSVEQAVRWATSLDLSETETLDDLTQDPL
ncbi:MAG: excinuclease ABC subunit UvrA, partial [Actinomycetota bacterium]